MHKNFWRAALLIGITGYVFFRILLFLTGSEMLATKLAILFSAVLGTIYYAVLEYSRKMAENMCLLLEKEMTVVDLFYAMSKKGYQRLTTCSLLLASGDISGVNIEIKREQYFAFLKEHFPSELNEKGIVPKHELLQSVRNVLLICARDKPILISYFSFLIVRRNV